MNILSIDIGSFSVKFLEVNIEKKSLQMIKFQEIPYNKIELEKEDSIDDPSLPLKLIRNYLDNTNFNGKVIFQIPPNLYTTRYLELPVANKKKAELMIPFQLEEDLPFGVGSAHFVSQLYKKEKSIAAIINLTKTDEFEEYYDLLMEHNVTPAQLTTEVSLLRSYADISTETDDFLILDIGHKYSKAYFFHDKKLVQDNYNRVGGDLLTNAISKTYNVSYLEAEAYKHENSFLLVDSQYNQVNKDQHDFALLMKNTLSPLIIDLKRWMLGYTLKTGAKVRRIYLIGGTSKINNFDNFLMQHVGVASSRLNALSLTSLKRDTKLDRIDGNHSITDIMALSQISGEKATNLLFGPFSSSYSDNIPLHSSLFVASRTYICAIFILIAMFVESTLLNSRIKTLDKRNIKLLNSPALAINPKIKRSYVKRPESVMAELKKSMRQLDGEVRAIGDAKDINDIPKIGKLSEIIGDNEKVEVTNLKTTMDQTEATIASKEISELNDLKANLLSSDLDSIEVGINNDKKVLKLSFKGN